jgi:integrase
LRVPILLDDDIVKNLAAPARGNAVTYDSEVKGFGCRVTAAGARSFILNYRTRDGRERRFTIGQAPGWKVKAARKEAGDIKAGIRIGRDPLAALEGERQVRREEAAQATMDTLCDRFEALHLPKLRGPSVRDYKSIIKLYIRPELGKLKVRDVTHAHVERLHRKVSQRAATRANRTVAVLSKMFSFAAKTPATDDIDPPVPMRLDGANPAKGIDRNPEGKRDRYLDEAERTALMKALAGLEDKQAASIIRLLVLTGARKGELMAARWSDFDLLGKTWTKPGATTKQKTLHHVPLSPPAAQLLHLIHDDMVAAAKAKNEAPPNDGYVFPGRKKGQPHRIEIKRAWTDVCVAAKMVKAHPAKNAKGEDITVMKPTARVHDLRHTYASILASSGLSLPIIGALLGHTQPSTTQRYSHLLTDALRLATEVVGEVVMPAAKPLADGDAA